ncbi:MAG: low molecular weight phosphotyrosine protein phosphatase [Pseudomonadota bacterium]|nr:MAG: low molecular weight phosphotyrosine protein phosphatase [Pseudomonadota bacterium]
MKRILFVCLGNICRSPTAKAVFDARLRRAGLAIETDSAGTIGYHAGSPPDPRAMHLARQRGLDLSDQRARELRERDFERFDMIYVMDRDNLEAVLRRRPSSASARVELVMSLAPDYGIDEVPDPYYGGENGFVRVVDMLEAAADRLARQLSERRTG